MTDRMKTANALRDEGGFTLLELLIVIGIVGILAAIGLPAMRQFVQNYQSGNAAAGLVTSLNYARSEAIKEDLPSAAGGGVTICASTLSASPPVCDSASWTTGYIVFSPATVGTQGPLQQVGALPGGASGITLTVTPATNSTIIFQPNGTVPALAVGGSGRAIFKLCDSRGPTAARVVELSTTGIIQASQIPGQDVSGTAVTCP